MANPNGSSANKPAISFGVSKLWIPHIAMILFIYYVLFSPGEHAAQHTLWTVGTYVRTLVGEKAVNNAVKFVWVAHALEAGYTVILARRYETTLGVGLLYALAALIFGKPGWEELSNRARESSARSKVV